MAGHAEGQIPEARVVDRDLVVGRSRREILVTHLDNPGAQGDRLGHGERKQHNRI